jgi:hypothetical protein
MSMKDLARDLAALKTLADAVNARIKTVKTQLEEQLDSAGVTRMDAVLPDNTKVATISKSSPKKAPQVVDEAAFLDWVREHCPLHVVEKVRPAFQAALLADMTKAGAAEWVDGQTGEVHEVPGVEFREGRASSCSVRPVDGGREALTAAWREDRLGGLDLPLLTAGGGDA